MEARSESGQGHSSFLAHNLRSPRPKPTFAGFPSKHPGHESLHLPISKSRILRWHLESRFRTALSALGRSSPFPAYVMRPLVGDEPLSHRFPAPPPQHRNAVSPSLDTIRLSSRPVVGRLAASSKRKPVLCYRLGVPAAQQGSPRSATLETISCCSIDGLPTAT